MIMRVAFVGAVGVPNNYGGFESFLESCAPLMAENLESVLITCDGTRYVNHSPQWRNVRRIFIPIPANGPLSVLHDLYAFFSVYRIVDAVVVLGVSGGIFFPLFRLLCALFGKRLIINVDGVEWRRTKFSSLKRAFLYLSDRSSQLFAHHVIVDNDALRPFLIKLVRNSATYIPYAGDHLAPPATCASAAHCDMLCLTICRIEPENNCHILLEAFMISRIGRYIFIGNWDASEYGRELRRKYKDVPGIEMRDSTYDKEIIASLRQSCTTYLHGHSVGGTNPSLVEILYYECRILAFDCLFNRCTAGEAVDYFMDANDLAKKIQEHPAKNAYDRTQVRAKYQRKNICRAYLDLIQA